MDRLKIETYIKGYEEAEMGQTISVFSADEQYELAKLALQSLSQEAVRDEALEGVLATAEGTFVPAVILDGKRLPDEYGDWRALPRHPTWQMKEAGGEAYLQSRELEGQNTGLTAMHMAEGIYRAMWKTSEVGLPSIALKREPNAEPQDRVAGDDQQCLSSGATSRSTPSGESPAVAASIRALLAEARGYLEGLELAERIDAALSNAAARAGPAHDLPCWPVDKPAPAAPDVAERLIDELEGVIGGYETAGGIGRLQLDSERAEIRGKIAALLARLGQGWIPVSERLPDATYGPVGQPPVTSDDVLVRWPNDEYGVACCDPATREWFEGDGGPKDCEPVCWMPIPI